MNLLLCRTEPPLPPAHGLTWERKSTALTQRSWQEKTHPRTFDRSPTTSTGDLPPRNNPMRSRTRFSETAPNRRVTNREADITAVTHVSTSPGAFLRAARSPYGGFTPSSIKKTRKPGRSAHSIVEFFGYALAV